MSHRPAGLRAIPVATATLALTGCELPSFWAPDPASEQGEDIFRLWQGTVVAALVVGAIVLALIFYVIVRYRRRDDSVPGQNAHNVPLELVYTAIPLLIVAVLFAFIVTTENRVTDLVDDPAVRVEVVGFQWQWQFRYPDQGVVVTGSTGEAPVLVLPLGQTTRLRLVASDVNHSFWVPNFLSKRDLIPGIDNEIDVTPTEPGEYEGRCAEFCGLDHWRMNFVVRVVSPQEFEQWSNESRSVPEDPRP